MTAITKGLLSLLQRERDRGWAMRRRRQGTDRGRGKGLSSRWAINCLWRRSALEREGMQANGESESDRLCEQRSAQGKGSLEGGEEE